jgi:hypothetical protein
MKTLIALITLSFASLTFAAEPAKKEEPKKEQTNCVTKDKKGNCPEAPKSPKPTPKKVEKKDEAKK